MSALFLAPTLFLACSGPSTDPEVVIDRRAPPRVAVSMLATVEGVTVSPGYNDHVLDFDLASWGRNPRPVDPTSPTTGPSPLDPATLRVSYAHDGFTDWYEQRPQGIKHGVDVHERPGGQGALRFTYGIASDLLPAFDDEAGAMLFVAPDSGHTALTYDGLVTLDSTGAELSSWMEFACDSNACEVSLVVDDTDAVYPITLDPVFVSNLTALPLSPETPTTNEDFGVAVDIYDDIAIVGSPTADDNGTNRGTAEIFRRSGTTWSHEQTLTPGENNNDRCGFSVAAGNGRVVVGCLNGNETLNDSGFAVVYAVTGTTWAPEDKLVDPSPVVRQRLGRSVDINPAGDRVIVGGWNGNRAGRVIIYERTGASWSDITTFNGVINADSGNSDRLGASTAITDDRAIAGAPLFDIDSDGDVSEEGAVYFYRRVTSPSVAWVLDQTETPYDGLDLQFGSSVDLDGSTAVVGEILEGGLVTVYDESTPGTWSATTTLSNGQVNGDFFGFSVAIDGDRVVVGAQRDQTSGISNSGSAHIFDRVNGTWVPSLEFAHTASNGGIPGGDFGRSVGVSGDYAIVGMEPRNGDEERAYILQLDICGPFASQVGCDVDLLITEFMPNPFNGADGQFVEVHNRGTSGVDLQGLEIETDAGSIVIADNLRVASGGYAIIAESGASTNGGLPATNLYVDAALSLGTTEDTLTLVDPDGVVLYSVDYDGFSSQGASLQLSYDAGSYADGSVFYAGPTSPGNHCETYSPLLSGDPSGDFMTPGADNDSCELGFDFRFTYADNTGPSAVDDVTSMTLETGGRFATGNGGDGDYTRTTTAAGQVFTLTYDYTTPPDPLTDVTYTSFLRGFGEDCFDGGFITNLPAPYVSGLFDNLDCS